jgi:hypothetical protein
MADGFYTDGMTVAEILALGDDILSKMSKRDLSRALRTVSLAANKRIDRLEKQAVKRKGGYVERKGGKGISTAALNAVTNDGKTTGKFKVGNKSRNQMYSEFARAREFMAMKSSTVKGAVAVRKGMEERAFGKTREEAAKGKTKKQQEAITRTFQDKVKEVYSEFRKFLEEENVDKGDTGRILTIIGKKIIGDNGTGDEAREAARQSLTEAYETKQQEHIEDMKNGSVLDDIDELNELWRI